jgi:hypothetical protein
MITKTVRLLLLLLLTAPVFAEGPFFDEYGQKDEYIGDDPAAWQEQSSEFPPLAKDEALLPFIVGGSKPRFHYAIDRISLNVGDDGVIRYSLVIESKSGVKNSSYEGIRCFSKEYKVYAYGAKNEFKAVRKPAWRRILPRNRYHMALFQDYLCNHTSAAFKPLSVEVAIDRILKNKPRQ